MKPIETNSNIEPPAKAATKSTHKKRRAWRKKFLRVLGRTGSPKAAARAASINHSTAYRRYHRDAGFAAEWDVAEERGKNLRFIECADALYKRGVKGLVKPI